MHFIMTYWWLWLIAIPVGVIGIFVGGFFGISRVMSGGSTAALLVPILCYVLMVGGSIMLLISIILNIITYAKT